MVEQLDLQEERTRHKLNDMSMRIQNAVEERLEQVRHRLSRLGEGSDVDPIDDAEDDVYERMGEFGRKAIFCEEKVETHLNSLFVNTTALDLRATCVEESFEKTVNRFVEQARLGSQVRRAPC